MSLKQVLFFNLLTLDDRVSDVQPIVLLPILLVISHAHLGDQHGQAVFPPSLNADTQSAIGLTPQSHCSKLVKKQK